MFWEKNYEIAFSLFNDTKILIHDEEKIKICEENKTYFIFVNIIMQLIQ